MTADDAAALELCTAPGLAMVHTRECPHLETEALQALVPATAEQLEELPMCSTCRSVLDGGRRHTFTSFDAALEAYQAPLENRPMMREIASELDFTEIWIPASSPYIAVSPGRGQRIVAYFNRGFVDIRDEDGQFRTVTLPVNWLRGGGSRAGEWREDEDRPVCDSCYMQLPTSGVCGSCDQ